MAAGVAALGCLIVLAGASAATRAEPPGAKFVGNDGEWFGLVSNSRWLANGKPAQNVQTNRPAIAKSGNPEEHEALQTIWSPTCSKGAQIVHFTRHVFVAGPLWKFGLYVGDAQPSGAVFGRFVVMINGRLVFKVNGGGGGLDETESKGSLVQWGDNLFEVIAYKKPFPLGYGCHKGGTGRTGIDFVFRGAFGNDLSLPSPPKEDYHPGGTTYQLTFSVAIRNNGPGGLGEGRLMIDLDAPQGQLTGVTQLKLPTASGSIAGCTERQNGREYKRYIQCRLVNLRRGVTIQPEFSFLGTAPDPRFDTRIIVASSVGGGYQLGDGRDNSKTDVVVFCGSQTTNPSCPK